jgi:hypothetical protein
MEDNSQKSIFNAGVGQAQEVRGQQNMLNKAKLDLLSMNNDPEYPQVINYELCLGLLTNMFKEVEPKCGSTEAEDIAKYKNIAEKFLETHPIMEQNNKGKVSIDYNSLKIFKKILEAYETKVRKALDKHEMNSPSKSDLSKSVIQM